MIHPFDIKDKSTWPPNGKHILILYKSYLNKIESTVVESDYDYPPPNSAFFDVVGASGYEYENDFETRDVIAWQEIPFWGDYK